MATPNVAAPSGIQFDKADNAWMLTCSGFVLIMIVSLCLVYSGLGSRSSAITLFKQPLITGALLGFQWYLWGYTLAFTPGNTWFGGTSSYNAIQITPDTPFAVGGSPPQYIPEPAFILFQGMFASFTGALICAGTMQRMHSARYLLFISVWSTLIYNPIARWSWFIDGWSHSRGSMDFAGGTPVHIASGTAVAALALFYFFESNGFHMGIAYLLGQVKTRIGNSIWWFLVMYTLNKVFGYKPWRPQASPNQRLPIRNPDVYDVNQVVLGTGLLWFGWFGFNGGSALGANNRAVYACLSTNIAACAGGITTVFLHWILKQWAKWRATWTNPIWRMAYDDYEFRRLTSIHFCDGALAGLVAITPGSGFVPVSKSAVFGFVSGAVVYLWKPDTSRFLRDDDLKVYLIHTVSGLIGMFLTGWVASAEVVESDGFSTWTDRSISERLGIQVADAVSGMVYSFFGTLAILMVGKLILFAVTWARLQEGRKAAWDEANVFTFYEDGTPGIEDRLRASLRQDWVRGDPENGIALQPAGAHTANHHQGDAAQGAAGPHPNPAQPPQGNNIANHN
ncbi:putative ammonium transporter [Podospora australis]|uniref:Ammonium transporter n=1 Tax=Podospora australis TaxID=1536484 RepID=A0AAN7AH58_9PEZI|nr:putative ammonium transporter [Podospora australis]